MQVSDNVENYENYKKVFDFFDKNKDGCISSRELEEVLESLGEKVSLSILQELISQLGYDNQDNINFQELYNLLEIRNKNILNEDDFVALFNIFDIDGNGVITANELVKVMKLLDEQISVSKAEELINEADLDGDGCINFHEFLRIMMMK